MLLVAVLHLHLKEDWRGFVVWVEDRIGWAQDGDNDEQWANRTGRDGMGKRWAKDGLSTDSRGRD